MLVIISRTYTPFGLCTVQATRYAQRVETIYSIYACDKLLRQLISIPGATNCADAVQEGHKNGVLTHEERRTVLTSLQTLVQIEEIKLQEQKKLRNSKYRSAAFFHKNKPYILHVRKEGNSGSGPAPILPQA